MAVKSSAVFAALLMIASPVSATADTHCGVPDFLSTPHAELPRVSIAVKRDRKLDILILSGSPSQTGAAKGLRSYPSYFEIALRQKLPALKIRVLVRAAPRRSVSETLPQLKNFLAEVQPALVIWQAGTVDAHRGIEADEFADALRNGVASVLQSGADTVLMDMQYSPRTDELIDSTNYLANMRSVAETTDVPLFDRYEIMRYWSESGAFDLTSLRNNGLYEKVHQCIGGLLADFVVRATSLEEFKGAAK